ncbi:MAG: hypothetical protein MR890_02700, partial [Akkermansia muciniphila]|nr:hypothetical protein [Akkermansia muciniphila]
DSVLGLRDVVPQQTFCYWGIIYPLLVWLVAEFRRREGESLWAGYNWLAIPGALAFLLWWFALSVFDPNPEYLLPMGAFFAVAALLLRPRGGWWTSWLGLMLIGGTALFLLCMLLNSCCVCC